MTDCRTIAASPEWVAAFARLAKLHSLSVGDLLGRIVLDAPESRIFECGSCGRPLDGTGRFPAIAQRAKGDPYALRFSFRLFAGGMAEVYGVDGDHAKYFCAGCTKVVIDPAARLVSVFAPKGTSADHDKAAEATRAVVRGLLASSSATRAHESTPEAASPAQIPASSDWVAAFARLAKLHSLSVGDLLGRIVLDAPESRRFSCGSCHLPFEMVGRFPAIPRRPPEDFFALRFSIRLFDSGLAEAYGTLGFGADGSAHFCAGCAKTVLAPIARWLAILTPKEAEAIAGRNETTARMMGFVERLFRPGALIAAPKETPILPPREE